MKDIGVDVRAPEGEWDGDQNCPFYGSLRLRDKLIGTVSSVGMSNSIIVQREVTRYMKKYERYERTRRYAAHLPSCIGEVASGKRPNNGMQAALKTVKFCVIERGVLMRGVAGRATAGLPSIARWIVLTTPELRSCN